MTGKTRYIGFAFLAALLALSSCRDLELQPVFYALSQEVPLGDDKGFPDEASVFKMVKVGTRYFAAANTLYTRTDGISDTWTTVNSPDVLSNALCDTLEVFSGQLYAGFYNGADGTGYGLWTAAPGAPPLVWTKIDDLGTGSYAQVTMLKATSLGTPTLFVATWAGTLFALSYSTLGTSGSFTVVSGGDWPAAASSSLPIIDVDSDGNFYWVIVGRSLYRDNVAPGVDTFLLLAPPTSDTWSYGGLRYDSIIPRLYLSAGNGFLHSSTDGSGPWTSTTASIPDENGDPVHFTTLAAPGADAGAVYVGTQGQGYYRIPGGDVTGTLTREPAYNITALYSGSLNFLFYDAGASPARLFLGTNGSGLWRGEYASGSTWTWKQE